MKNFIEKLKDILYASIDYVIMLSIIGGVILIIGWRLDILFQKDVLASVNEDEIRVEIEKEEKPNIKNEEEDQDKAEDNSVETGEDVSKEPSKDSDDKESKAIEIKIPEGSFPAQIGSILESNGLVESGTDFVKKAVDLNLDTKLKSGSFTISPDSSLENMVKIIAKQIPGN